MVVRSAMVIRSLALVVTALILFFPANFFPIMRLDLLGQEQQATVWDSVLGLYNSGMQIISLLVLCCSFVIPFSKLCCQFYVLLALYFNKGKHFAIWCFTVYQKLREWGMLEIYFMGILVSIVKLHGMADLHIGMGLFCFIALLFVQVWLEVVMSPSQVWSLLGDQGSYDESH